MPSSVVETLAANLQADNGPSPKGALNSQEALDSKGAQGSKEAYRSPFDSLNRPQSPALTNSDRESPTLTRAGNYLEIALQHLEDYFPNLKDPNRGIIATRNRFYAEANLLEADKLLLTLPDSITLKPFRDLSNHLGAIHGALPDEQVEIAQDQIAADQIATARLLFLALTFSQPQ